MGQGQNLNPSLSASTAHVHIPDAILPTASVSSSNSSLYNRGITAKDTMPRGEWARAKGAT